MKTILKKILPLVLLSVFVTHCSFDISGITEELTADNSVTATDGGTYTPTSDGTSNLCETDSDDNCVDSTDTSSIVYMNDVSFNFGFSEIGNVECGTLAIPGGMVYQAEIDKTTDVDGNSTTSIDADGVYLFAPADSSGEPTQERTSTTQGDVTLCYLRTEVGEHHGSIIVSFKDSASESWQYIVTAQVEGETGEDPFWNITAPVDGAVYDEREGFNDGVDNTEGDILVNAAGSISESYHGILKDGLDTPIGIVSDTLEYSTTLSSSGEFAQQIALPQVPGVYSVKFSADTNRGTTITQTNTVVVSDIPEIEILVKDGGGTDIETTVPTDLQDLILGIRVKNLEVSGPNSTDRSVQLYDIFFNSVQIADDISIWNEDGSSWCSKDGTVPTTSSNDYTGFDSWNTYCIPLSDVTNVTTGINTISVKASNALGESEADFSLVIDYAKPSIDITSPVESVLMDPNVSSITISGTIKNFAGHDVDHAPVVVEGDTGSYCISSDTTTCEDSVFQLWVNSNVALSPITIYPEYDATYANKTNQEINALISTDNPEQCLDFTEETSHFSGDSDNTTVDSDYTITTTVTTTNSDQSTTTTVYETNTDGTITRTIDGIEEILFEYTEAETSTREVTVTDDGTITTVIYDATTDQTTTYVTDGRTGEISESSTRFECNIPEATFSITLSKDAVPLNLFSNILEFRAESISGHRAIDVRTFQLGKTVAHTELNNTLTLGALGTISPACTDKSCVERSPVMLHISEGTLKKNTTEGEKMAAVLEYMLNENMPFENLANGWPLPENEDGDIDLEVSFKEQFNYPSDDVPNFDWLPEEDIKTAIYQGIHKQSMAEKFLALKNLQFWKTYSGALESGDINNNTECNIYNNHLCFFENAGDPLASDLNEAYNVAKDSSGQTITSAFVPLRDLQYVTVRDYLSNEFMVWGDPSWPTAIAGTNLDFNDFDSGKWVVDRNSIEMKANGRVDVKICVLPDEDRYTSCDDDVSDANTPALKGTFVQNNLIKGGLLGNDGIDDFTVPMRWNVGKIILDLKDICFGSKSVCDPTNTDYSDTSKNNILNIDKDNLVSNDIDIIDPESSIDSISLIPFTKCREIYKSDWISNRNAINESDGTNWSTAIAEENYPIGCPAVDSGEPVFPVVIENNSYTSDRVAAWIVEMDKKNPEKATSDWLLHMIWNGVEETFVKLISNLDTEMANATLGVYNNRYDGTHPAFTYEGDVFSTAVDWEDIHADLNAKQSDIIISENGLTARLSMTVGVDGVDLSNTTSTDDIAFLKGHLTRSLNQGNLDDYPLLPEDASDAFFSGSVSEELFNAISYLIFKKGPFSWLDVLEMEDLETNGVDTATVNAVSIANFGICNTLAGGALSPLMPPSLLFAGASTAYDANAISIDLILDQDHPPTFAMAPYTMTTSDGSPADIQDGHAVELKIGLTNVQASFKNFVEVEANRFEIGDEVFLLRFDAVLSVVLVYYPDERKIHAFFPQNQNYHLSVVPGHNGPIYDDVTIVSDLSGLFGTVFAKFEKNVVYTSDDSLATAVISLAGASNSMLGDSDTSKISIASLQNVDIVFNMDQATNGECVEGEEPQYYTSTTSGSHSRTRRFQFKDRTSRNISATAKELPASVKELGVLATSPGQSNAFENLFILDPCMLLSVNSETNTELNKELCDVGIDDVLIEPTLVFDSTNGYIHFGGKATVDLEDWLQEKL